MMDGWMHSTGATDATPRRRAPRPSTSTSSVEWTRSEIAAIRTTDPMSNPFVRADAWRAHPLLNKPWGHAFPGLALGAALFAGYVAMDKAKTATAAKSAAKSGGGERGR